MFDDIIKMKKPMPEKLITYGFEVVGEAYRYDTMIQNGEFKLTIFIKNDGTIDTNLIEKETDEPYILYKTKASGAYINTIRNDIEHILKDIAEKCYEISVFKTRQAQMIIDFCKETYNDELEFLWIKSPDNAVWRRKDSQKWYGVLLTLSGKKIGLETDEVVEIIDLRMNPTEAEMILAQKDYYPGWHMNKKSWYTLVLNESISDNELENRIRQSYELAR
ncbi:MAG: MmcQ/YjbR family DNA-binding protein [Cellulosilyticaceae bacterium]